jgi:hypothetical protein
MLASQKRRRSRNLANRCQNAMDTVAVAHQLIRCGVDHGRGHARDQVAMTEPSTVDRCARS